DPACTARAGSVQGRGQLRRPAAYQPRSVQRGARRPCAARRSRRERRMSNHMDTLHDDPYLALPLHGVQLIEASAGTGKTFTLATLFTRLVVEQGLRIGQVLAVTFTDAATQELRKRIRERLALAAQLVDRAPADDDTPDVLLTRWVLQR